LTYSSSFFLRASVTLENANAGTFCRVMVFDSDDAKSLIIV